MGCALVPFFLLIALGPCGIDPPSMVFPLLFNLVSSLSGSLTGYWVGRNILNPPEGYTLEDLKECGARRAILSTVSVLSLLGIFLFFFKGLAEGAKFIGSHPGLIFCLIIWSLLFGYFISDRLVRMERNNLIR